MNNILITAIGSMSAEYVIRELREENKVVGCDIYPSHWHFQAKLCHNCYQVPLATDNNYVKALLNICKQEAINFLVPLTDLEIDILNKNRRTFAENNVVLCMPSEESLKISRDKLALYYFFRDDEQVSVIKTVNRIDQNEEVSFPLIAKPYNGRSSEGLFLVKNQRDLDYVLSKEGYIFQEYKEGSVFTVDCVRNADTKVVVAIAREELLRTKNGAGLTVRLTNDQNLLNKVHYIANQLDINGCVNIEFIKNGQAYYLIDINPRFSAGVAFSAQLGYDVANNHLRCFVGEDIAPSPELEEKIMTKKFHEIIL